MRVGHAPVETAAGRFIGLSEWGAQHHGVRTADHGLAYVATGTESAISNNRHVTAGTPEVVFTGCCALEGGGDLRNANPHHFAGGAGGSGADADQQAVDPSFHQLYGHFIGDAVPDNHWDFQGVDKFGEDQPAVAVGHVAGGGDGGLDYDHVGPGFYGRGGHALGVLRGEGYCTGGAGVLDLPDPLTDKLFTDGFGIYLLKEFGY